MKITLNHEHDLLRNPPQQYEIEKKCVACSYTKQEVISHCSIGNGNWKHRWFGYPACYGGKFNGFKEIWISHLHCICKRCGNQLILPLGSVK